MKRHERGSLVRRGGVGRRGDVGEMRLRLIGGVEGRDWWLERIDNDCECDEGEGVMSEDDGSGGDGEEPSW